MLLCSSHILPRVLWALGIILSTAAHAQESFTIDGRSSGHWRDPARDGEGLTVEIFAPDRGGVIWFTYDNRGAQVWLTGVGTVSGSSLIIDDATITAAATFSDFDPDDVIRTSWGSLHLEFTACDAGSMIYSGPPEFGSGSIQLQRLVGIQGFDCNGRRRPLLGFTPFPFDLPDSQNTVLEDVYSRLRDDGDIVAHHFDDGIPWPEAAAGGGVESYHPALLADWQFRRDMTPPGHKVYVAITPISISREQLAPYRGAQPDTPLAELGEPWQSAGFADPLVKQAYLQHAINTVEFFRPDYLAMAIEANLLMKLRPEHWNAFMDLQASTWQALKQRYPSLPVFVTMTAHDLLPGLTDADAQQQQQALRDVLPVSDLLGLSFYPFLSVLGTGPVDADVFTRLAKLTDKPMAIAETGMPAQEQTLQLGEVDDPVTLLLDGSASKQADYMRQLLQAAQQHDFRFVIQFVAQDYDQLCMQLECSDFQRLWQDTGLWDEQGQAREALSVWRNWLARPLAF